MRKKDYRELEQYRAFAAEYGIDGAMMLTLAKSQIATAKSNRDLRNALCEKCGKYSESHLGACDGCRWRKQDV